MCLKKRYVTNWRSVGCLINYKCLNTTVLPVTSNVDLKRLLNVTDHLTLINWIHWHPHAKASIWGYAFFSFIVFSAVISSGPWFHLILCFHVLQDLVGQINVCVIFCGKVYACVLNHNSVHKYNQLLMKGRSGLRCSSCQHVCTYACGHVQSFCRNICKPV